MANFSDALEWVRQGGTIRREDWKWDGSAREVRFEDTSRFPATRMEPFFVITTGTDLGAMWTPTTQDLLANDWRLTP